jgi:signal transduction histidine kinase
MVFATGETAREEVDLLLTFSGTVARCTDLSALEGELEAMLDRILPWSAFVLLPGIEPPRTVWVHGGARLDRAGRARLEKELREMAREWGVACGPLRWAGEPATGPTETIRHPGPVVIPLPRRGGGPGLLVVHPAPGQEAGEDQRRLLAAVAQQVVGFLARWQESAERAEARLEALISELPCGILLADDGGRLCRINPAGQRLLESLLGATPDIGVDVADLPLPRTHMPAGETVEFSGRRDQKVYVARWLPLDDPRDSRGRVVVLEDVTAERGRRDQAMQAEKMFALGEMLSGVAHELNNPLASVVGFSQLLLKQAEDDGTRRRLGIIVDEAQRARRIVHNLLDVARVRPPEKAPVKLDDVVQGILDLFAYQFRVDQVRVEWTPAGTLPPVAGDRHQLQQILVNLVSNAHQALRRFPGERVLRLEADAAGGRVRIQIADSGPGIPEAQLDRIFEPFFTTKEPGVGTGLGLAIARKIATEHGGSLHARSQVGSGAVFTLDLPACEVVQATDGRPAEERLPARPARVLIVEDEEAFRLLLEESLQQEGWTVTAAADGAEALSRMAGSDFDVVISDLRMPVMDGVQLFQRTRERRPELAARFVFITGDLLDPVTRRFLDDCGAPCLLKPFGLDELNALLARVHAGTARPRRGSVLDSPARGRNEASPRVD